jgi:undecaprenyl-diphosphatase
LNDYLLSVVLGIVEGLTEFLPVSSTAHLRIAESLLHISLSDGYWKMYTIVIQLGAILCLPIYFRHRLAKFIATFPAGERGDRSVATHPLSLTLMAFVVTAIPAFLLTKVIGKHLESLNIMGSSLLIGGVAMWVIDALNAKSETQGPNVTGGRIHTWHMEEMSLGQAVWIGACQILSAVFPGTSRSMSTIAAGQLAGMSRASALEFSFFLSIPTMVTATGYDLLKSLRGKDVVNPIGVSRIDRHGWVVLAIGFVVSFLVAYGSVAWFMAWVRKRGFAPFAVYRIIVGVLVLGFAARLASGGVSPVTPGPACGPAIVRGQGPQNHNAAVTYRRETNWILPAEYPICPNGQILGIIVGLWRGSGPAVESAARPSTPR